MSYVNLPRKTVTVEEIVEAARESGLLDALFSAMFDHAPQKIGAWLNMFRREAELWELEAQLREKSWRPTAGWQPGINCQAQWQVDWFRREGPFEITLSDCSTLEGFVCEWCVWSLTPDGDYEAFIGSGRRSRFYWAIATAENRIAEAIESAAVEAVAEAERAAKGGDDG